MDLLSELRTLYAAIVLANCFYLYKELQKQCAFIWLGEQYIFTTLPQAKSSFYISYDLSYFTTPLDTTLILRQQYLVREQEQYSRCLNKTCMPKDKVPRKIGSCYHNEVQEASGVWQAKITSPNEKHITIPCSFYKKEAECLLGLFGCWRQFACAALFITE